MGVHTSVPGSGWTYHREHLGEVMTQPHPVCQASPTPLNHLCSALCVTGAPCKGEGTWYLRSKTLLSSKESANDWLVEAWPIFKLGPVHVFLFIIWRTPLITRLVFATGHQSRTFIIITFPLGGDWITTFQCLAALNVDIFLSSHHYLPWPILLKTMEILKHYP